MISYCIAAYRPQYTRALVESLVGKTSAPFEVLLWLNVADEGFEGWIAGRQAAGAPIRVVGQSPDNIGMRAYARLLSESRYEMVVQIDDDVICVSPGIAETAAEVFAKFPRVGMLTADTWQDAYTNGARPPMSHYRLVDAGWGLYDGPIDGWFSIYRKSALARCGLPRLDRYTFLGGRIKQRLARIGMQGLLCTRFRVFHATGPEYASYFGLLEFEIEKYRSLGRHDIVEWYSSARDRLPDREVLGRQVERIFSLLS
ncbi:MAG: glycosyltransferase family 2 protein [Vicinamibacterales bacterium]